LPADAGLREHGGFLIIAGISQISHTIAGD
jgi:hypothetical protein